MSHQGRPSTRGFVRKGRDALSRASGEAARQSIKLASSHIPALFQPQADCPARANYAGRGPGPVGWSPRSPTTQDGVRVVALLWTWEGRSAHGGVTRSGGSPGQLGGPQNQVQPPGAPGQGNTALPRERTPQPHWGVPRAWRRPRGPRRPSRRLLSCLVGTLPRNPTASRPLVPKPRGIRQE